MKYSEIMNLHNMGKVLSRLLPEQIEQVMNLRCEVTEKIHGCLQAETNIYLADGTKKTIREIVQHKLKLDVLSINDKGQLISTKIINWFDNGSTDEWFKVKFTRNKIGRGNYYGSVDCTSNHRFYNPTNKKYIKCSDLKIGDKILVKRERMHIPFFQQQVLIGKLLGDAHLNNNHIIFRHTQQYEKYTDYTLESLGYLKGNKRNDEISGYGSKLSTGESISSFDIDSFIKTYFTFNNKKEVNKDIIGQLTPISLAFWYMDDGSLLHHSKQEDRASLATCNFSENSINILIESLKHMGLNATKLISENKYWRINFNADESDKLFTLISPYVIKEMQYKLPKQYQNRFNKNIIFKNEIIYKPILVEQQILSIEKLTNIKKVNKHKYDIETESHNFIANGVVVHNSNFRVGKTKDNTYFIGQKNQFFPEGQYASHPNWYKMSETAQRDIMMVLDYCKGFYDREIVFYGELCGNGLQSGFTFPFDKYEILFIDVKVGETYWNKDESRQLIQRLGLKYIPFVGYMKLSEALNLDVDIMSSNICNEDYIEGVVITPVEYPDFWRLQSRLIIKHKTAKFSEVAKSKKDKGLKQINWMVEYKTEFSDFVTFGRFENVLSHCRETMEVHDDMSDLRFLIAEMVKDIEKEENDGQPLDAPSRKYLGKYIPIKYKEYLNEKTKEVISKSIEPKKKTRRTKKSTEE